MATLHSQNYYVSYQTLNNVICISITSLNVRFYIFFSKSKLYYHNYSMELFSFNVCMSTTHITIYVYCVHTNIE